MYLADPAPARRAAHPAIVESIRAGLVFGLKEAVGVDLIDRPPRRAGCRRALDRWRQDPDLEILGNLDAPRLPIISFRVRHGERYLHHNFVVAVLNDLFGIQARGGCSCAGPYGHRLLGIDLERSHAIQQQVTAATWASSPAGSRVNFHYTMSESTVDYIIDAVDLVGATASGCSPTTSSTRLTGRWRHRDGLVEPPIRLGAIGYADDGSMVVPRSGARGGEDLLAEHLREGAAILAAATPPDLSLHPADLSADFEHLRWFDLPESAIAALSDTAGRYRPVSPRTGKGCASQIRRDADSGSAVTTDSEPKTCTRRPTSSYSGQPGSPSVANAVQAERIRADTASASADGGSPISAAG